MSTEDRGEPPQAGSGPGSATGRGPRLTVIRGGAGREPDDGPAMPSTGRPLTEDGASVLRRLGDLIGAERAFLFVWNEAAFALELARPALAEGERPLDPQGLWPLLDRVVAERAPLVMGLTERSPADVRASGVTEQLRMGVAVPLLTPVGMAGVLCLDRRLSRGVFTDSDATVVDASMRGMGLDAARVADLLEGTAGCRDMLEVDLLPPVQRALGDAQACAASEGAALDVTPRLRPPEARFVDFWHRADAPEGQAQLILGRLCLRRSGQDDFVRALACCYRALTQVGDLGPDDIAQGLRAALVGLPGAPPYWLGLSVLRLDLARGAGACWRAGDGAVVVEQAGGAVELALGAQAPLDSELDELVCAPLAARAGDRVHCFAACGPAGASSAGPDVLRALREHGPSALTIELRDPAPAAPPA